MITTFKLRKIVQCCWSCGSKWHVNVVSLWTRASGMRVYKPLVMIQHSQRFNRRDNIPIWMHFTVCNSYIVSIWELQEEELSKRSAVIFFRDKKTFSSLATWHGWMLLSRTCVGNISLSPFLLVEQDSFIIDLCIFFTHLFTDFTNNSLICIPFLSSYFNRPFQLRLHFATLIFDPARFIITLKLLSHH